MVNALVNCGCAQCSTNRTIDAMNKRIQDLEEVNRKQNLEIMRLLNDKKMLERIVELAKGGLAIISLSHAEIHVVAEKTLAQIEGLEK